MALTPTQEPSTGMSAAQLAYLLWQQQQASAEAGSASDAARGLSQNYTDRANAQIKTGDAYYDMLMALQGQLATTPEQDAGDLESRTNQIASGLNGTVDRAAALAGSQAGAQLRKRGMGDSTQAASATNDLTRQYGDVYQKIQEMARQRAFDELKTKQGLNQNMLGTVGTGLLAANGSNLTNAREMSAAASSAASSARQNVGAKTQNVLESKLMEAMLGSKAVKGGFDDATNYLVEKAKGLFAPSEFDASAFYSAPKEALTYDNWKASENASLGITAPTAPVTNLYGADTAAAQEPVWFSQYDTQPSAPGPAVNSATPWSVDTSFVAPVQEAPQEQQWYTPIDSEVWTDYESYDVQDAPSYADNVDYSLLDTWQATQETPSWDFERSWE